MKRALAIDGPLTGQLLEFSSVQDVWVVPLPEEPLTISAETENFYPVLRVVHYRINRCMLFSRVIYIATSAPFPAAGPDPDVLFSLLASPEAKAAEEPGP